MSAETPFTVRSGVPTVIEVSGKDGKLYEVRVQLAILDVQEAPTVGSDGMPAFQIQAQVASVTARKPS